MLFFLFSTLLPISTYSEESNIASRKLPYLKNINSDVQLKDNGWIKILEENSYLITPEQYYKNITDDESKIEEYAKTRRSIAKYFGHDENYRIIYVKIQFLNYCKASVDEYEVAKHKKEWDDAFDRFEKMLNKKPAKEIDVVGWLDVNTPRFRCNYRTTLMTSFYSSTGEEVKTEKYIPIAKWETDKKRKEEMLPGETMTIPITVPDKAGYWYVWVPK